MKKFSVIIAQGDRDNLICAAGGFNSWDEAYDWASQEGLTGRIGFAIMEYTI